MDSVKRYLSLVKFSHTIFAMPFAIIGFFLGLVSLVNHVIVIKASKVNSSLPYYSFPAWMPRDVDIFTVAKIFFLVILCMIFARSAAMAFNRYLDSHFDARNPRTAIREIPAGIISKENALRFVIINCILFILATFFINRICFYLSPVALFIILFYSYTKRFTAFCHLVLGTGLSLAPIGSYLAVTGRFDVLPVLFSFTVLFWVSGFDIIYALQDETFDRSNKLHSIPAALGKTRALKVSELLHVISSAFVISAGVYGDFGYLYWVGVIVFIGMLIFQHSVVKPDDLSKVNLAFMTSNGIASIVFALFVLWDIFLL